MARPWLRLYRKIVESKKAHDLHPTMFKAWIMLLACTDDDGNLPSPEQLSFKLRQPEIRINAWLETLARFRFLDETETGYAAHDWCDWNFDSDVSTERVKRFRQQKRNALDTDTDTDTESTHRRGTRWPEGQEVNPDWIRDGSEARVRASLNPIDLEFEAREFVSYFTSADCKQPVKKDWHAAWLRWCRMARGKSNGPRLNGAKPESAFARIQRKIEAARAEQER